MDVRINTPAESEKELFISVPWDEVKEDYAALLSHYSKMPLRGFRPGHTPVGAVESAFRTELREGLASACSTRICRTALSDNSLAAASPIEISEIELDKGKKLSFKAFFIEPPQLDIPDYKNIKLKSQGREQKLDEISEHLLISTPMNLHPSLTANEMEYSEGGQESGNDMVEAAAQRVKLMIILRSIAHREGLEVDEQTIAERLENLAAENGTTAAGLRQYLESQGAMERFRDSLLAEEVLDFIISTN